MTAGQKYVRKHERTILVALVEKAKEGSLPHAKFALEYAELMPEDEATKEEDELPGPSLAEMLLSKLAVLEEQPGEEAGAPETV